MRCWSLRQSVKKLERRIWRGGTNLAKALFKKVLEYAGDYRKLTYASVIVMLFGVAVSVLPLLFAWQIITPLMGYGENGCSVCLFTRGSDRFMRHFTWKVYGKTESMQRKFAQYRKCTQLYCEAFQKHHSFDRLIVGSS